MMLFNYHIKEILIKLILLHMIPLDIGNVSGTFSFWSIRLTAHNQYEIP